MSANKKVINFTIVISTISFCLTYFFGLNNYYIWFEFKWLPNSFLLTILGGIFSSSIVVSFCEICNYIHNKNKAENALFSHSIILYSNATIIKNNLAQLVANPNNTVSHNLLEFPKTQMAFALYNIMNVDYTTFCKKQSLKKSLNEFRSKYNEINNNINQCDNFKLAILETKLEEIEKNKNCNVVIDGSYPKIKQISEELIKEYGRLIIIFEELLNKIDYSSKYNWVKNNELK